MKKYFYLLIVVATLFAGCSSDSDNNQDIDFDLGYMNFKLENYFNFEDVFLGPQWYEYINNDGSVTHTLSCFVGRVGNNPLFSQDFISVDISFTLNGPLQVNQIIQLNNISIDFPLPHNNLNYDIADYCSNLYLYKDNLSTGFLKITQIDNANGFIYGEFKFNNLKRDDLPANPLTNEPCDFPSQQNYNIINGSFKASTD
jgi:hypothetical protein